MNTEQLTYLRAMADAADRRCGSPGHARRVYSYANALTEAVGLRGPDADQILVAAYLHDIGKVLIPDSILQKRGPLSAEEWVVIRKHPLQGADLLMTHTALAASALLVRSHHERPDGLGYPYGLSGPLIPQGAGIVAIADSFDAMVTPRPYSTGISVAAAIQRLRLGAGAQWDGTLVTTFLDRVLPRLERAWILPDEPVAAAASRAGYANRPSGDTTDSRARQAFIWPA